MESSEVIAIDEEAAIGSSGKLTRNGLPPWAGTRTSIAERDEACCTAPIAGVCLRGAGPLCAPLFGLTPTGECAGWGFAIDGVISPAESLRAVLSSESAEGLNSIFGDEFDSAGAAPLEDSEPQELPLILSSEGMASFSLFAPAELSGSSMVFDAS
jgi:hypothetical protein